MQEHATVVAVLVIVTMVANSLIVICKTVRLMEHASVGVVLVIVRQRMVHIRIVQMKNQPV